MNDNPSISTKKYNVALEAAVDFETKDNTRSYLLAIGGLVLGAALIAGVDERDLEKDVKVHYLEIAKGLDEMSATRLYSFLIKKHDAHRLKTSII